MGYWPFLSIIIGVVCYAIGRVTIQKKRLQEKEKATLLERRYLHTIRLYNLWMELNDRGNSIVNYLENQEVKEVAIYGTSYFGTRLYYHLENAGINVLYAIDKSPKFKLPGIEIYPSPKDAPSHDAVMIVTAIYAYQDIKKMLLEEGYTSIYSLDEILYYQAQSM